MGIFRPETQRSETGNGRDPTSEMFRSGLATGLMLGASAATVGWVAFFWLLSLAR